MVTARSLKNRTAVRDGSYVMIDQAMMSLGTFLASVLVARATTKEEFGIYVLGFSIISIALNLHRATVVLPFTVYCPRLGEAERKTYQASGLIHTILLSLLVMTTLALWFLGMDGRDSVIAAGMLDITPYLGLLLLPYLLREFMRSASLAQLQFLPSMLANVTASILMVALILTAFFMGGLTVKIAYASMAVASLVAVATLAWRQWDRMTIRLGMVWKDFKRSLTIGRWFIVNSLAFTVISQIYPWLILYFLDSSAVAAFGASLAVAGVMTPLLRGANAYMLPRMTHSLKGKDSTDLYRIMKKSILVLMVPFGIWTVVGSLFAEPIMTFFYSDRYHGYGILVSLLIVKTTIESISTPMTSALHAMERPNIATASLICGAMVSLIFGYPLVKNFSLVGAGLTAVLASMASALWKWAALRRIGKSGPVNLIAGSTASSLVDTNV
jgi:O-antigen/teichoic acid export membrane protein